MHNYVLIKSFATEFEAELVKQKLEELGIQPMIQAEDLSQVLPSLDYTNGVNLYVLPADEARAREALSHAVEESNDTLADDMET
jgi:hypothetical protein